MIEVEKRKSQGQKENRSRHGEEATDRRTFRRHTHGRAAKRRI
jgi:hypothetical protein